MESSTGESAELLTGRPVEGGMRLRSPEVAMGSGSGMGGWPCGDGLRPALGQLGDSLGSDVRF